MPSGCALILTNSISITTSSSDRPLRDGLPNWGLRESSMSKPGLDGRHRNKDGEISGKHGNTLVRTLRKVYGQGFAAGYLETAKLSEVMFHLNETSLSQLRRDHETDHLEHKIAQASKGTQRQQTLKAGTISFGGSGIDCLVRKMSGYGANLEVESQIGIPNSFDLAIDTEHSNHHCHVVWRKARRIGIAFD